MTICPETGKEGDETLHICPECGTHVDRRSGYPYWADRETKQRHHDPCPTDEDRAQWEDVKNLLNVPDLNQWVYVVKPKVFNWPMGVHGGDDFVTNLADAYPEWIFFLGPKELSDVCWAEKEYI